MITWDSYFSRLMALRKDAELARKAIGAFSGAEEAMDVFARGELEDLRRIFREACDKDGSDLTATWVYSDQARIIEYLADTKANIGNRLGGVNTRLLQNEFILQVAIFECFMKDVHRTILRHDPKRLKADRKVDLGRLVSQGQDSVIQEEIDREVASLDRMNSRQKCDYFRERLGIDWYGGTIVPLLDRVLELRNKILHEDPTLAVTDRDSGLMHVVTFMLPLAVLAQAAVLYPGSFELPMNMTENEIRQHLLKRKSSSDESS